MSLSAYTEYKPKFFKRILWICVRETLFRLLFFQRLYFFRNLLLRMFGAEIPTHALIYSSCTIFAPWNLKIGLYSCIGPHTVIYNKAPIEIGSDTVISQGAFLCTASHDIASKKLPLVTAPIRIGDFAWIAADAFVGMGVHIGDGAVVGARGCVFKDVEAWTIVGGNPAKFIKKRVLKDE